MGYSTSDAGALPEHGNHGPERDALRRSMRKCVQKCLIVVDCASYGATLTRDRRPHGLSAAMRGASGALFGPPGTSRGSLSPQALVLGLDDAYPVTDLPIELRRLPRPQGRARRASSADHSGQIGRLHVSPLCRTRPTSQSPVVSPSCVEFPSGSQGMFIATILIALGHWLSRTWSPNAV